MKLLLADENFPFPSVTALQNFGHDIKTLNDYNKNNISLSDPEVLAFARKERRAVVTLNRKDFISLHHEVKNHAGIVVCIFDLDFDRLARAIHQSISSMSTLTNHLIRIDSTKSS